MKIENTNIKAKHKYYWLYINNTKITLAPVEQYFLTKIMTNITTMYENFTVLLYFSHYDNENLNKNVFLHSSENLGKEKYLIVMNSVF